ncbi:MAG: AAA family ATPase [Cyanobacteria bacterium J06632_22]
MPFSAEDPLALIHDHIAQHPRAADQVNPSVPPMVTALVAKLMSKNAEDRYQSARGLKYDLEQCLTQYKTQGKITEFDLGQRDLSDRFLIPEKLYGREIEVAELLQAFDRVCQGASELMLVAGFSGIGKTAVVNEVHKPIVRQRGYFIKGKFDQLNRNVPLSAFLQALQDLLGQLLAESDEQLQTWKTRILDAVGEDGQVLIDVMPTLQHIIGDQPPVSGLSGKAAQNRFNRRFQQFIEVFTAAEHPLVIFLDDLQWADATSLQLVQLLMKGKGHLLLLGAYRDNEVSSIHPLALALEEMGNAQTAVNTMTLGPLQFEQVNHLIADTLHCSTSLARPLAELIQSKTQGNPFFTTQFLKALYDSDQFTFNYDQNYWQCDIAQVRAAALTTDVVEFMAQQLQKLPLDVQQALQLAACIGNQFDLTTLAIVSDVSPTTAAATLWQALQAGVILPTSQIYKFFQSGLSEPSNQVNPTYRFLHDRVQQAAYGLIPDAEKQATHLKIGQLLFNRLSAVDVKANIFSIVNHWNIGATLLQDDDERMQLCQLNFSAACKAKGATAYAVAYEYATMGIRLLGEKSWQAQPELTQSLHEQAAETAYLKGDFAASQQWTTQLLQNRQTVLASVKAYEIKLLTHVAQKQSAAAIETGQDILEKLGISLPITPTEADVQTAWAETAAMISQTEIQSLLHRPVMTDTHALAALQILNSMAATVYLSRPELFPLVVLAQVNLSLTKGNTAVSAGAYARYSFMLCSTVDNLEQGYAFGRLALQLSEQFNNKEIATRVLLMVGALTLPWKVHLREGIPLLETAYQYGVAAGNLDGAALSHYYESQSRYLVGEQLSDLAHKVAIYSEQLRQTKQALHCNNNELLRQVILNLMGQGDDPCQLVGEAFDERKMLPLYQAANNMLGLFSLYLHKTILCYWFGHGQAAMTYATTAQRYLSGSRAQATVPLFYFYDALAQFTQYASGSAQVQQAILDRVAANQEKLKQWAHYAPMNFQHKYDLVRAERCHYLGQRAAAIVAYDDAIAGAQGSGYLQEEALANELAAKFYLGWGKEKVAAGYMQEAYYGYSRWGAEAKVADLETRYAELLQPILQQETAVGNVLDTLMTISGSNGLTRTRHRSDGMSLNQTFDFVSVLKASQTLSGTIHLDELLRQLTQIILQNSAGDRCALILPDGQGNWRVRAIATAQTIQLCDDPLACHTDLPVKLIQYVKNVQVDIVIDDLETELPVLDDYLRQQQPKSLLCLPICSQSRCIGILSLENQLTRHVFTDERILVLNFLCTQAAISLENARLYQQSQRQEQYMRSLYDGVAHLIFVVDVFEDSDFRWQGWNIAAEKATGIPSSHVMGKSAIDIFGDAEGKVVEGHMTDCVTARQVTSYEEVLTFHGEQTWWLTTLNPLYDEQNRVYRIVGTTMDITTLKRTEAALRDSESSLAQKATDLTDAMAELQQTQLKLVQSEKMSALGGLVAGVAHEINNPVGCIIGNVGATQVYIDDLLSLLDRYAQEVPAPSPQLEKELEAVDLDYVREDLPKLIRAMQDSGQRIKSISRSLRTFSRADRETKQMFNLHEGIDSTVLILRHRLKANEHRPEIAVVKNYGDIPEVACFPGQLNQVFMNILANAIDALDEASQGRNYEDMQAEPHQIRITTAVDYQQIRLEIADNGPGMPATVRAKIFDHLFTTKSVGKGTGLGLAIAKQIVVETHGGQLDVQSEIGQGTQLCIYLPLLPTT